MHCSARSRARVELLSAAAFLTVVVSTACTRIGEAATSKGVATPRVPTPCYLDGSAPKCPGVLSQVPADGSAWSAIADAIKAINANGENWIDGQPSNRRPKIKGNFAQRGNPLIHPHSRDAGFDLEKIPANTAVVVASVKFKPGVKFPDAYYLAGASASGGDNAIVVYKDGLAIPEPGDGTADKYIAKWAMFERDGNKARLINAGYIRLCKDDSKPPVDGPYADFHTCKAQNTLMKISDSLKIPMDTIRKVMKKISLAAIQHGASFAQELRGVSQALSARSMQFTFPQSLTPAKGLELLKALAAYSSPEDGPLWISCGQGCCTVDTEK
jgi:hypothetical protein